MATIIKMRRMSDTMEEGVLVEWLVKVGDQVKIGDVLAEVETDKATMDFDSQADGTILHIEAEVGATIPVDGVMAVIGDKDEDFQSALKDALSAKPANETVKVAEEKIEAAKPAEAKKEQPVQKPAEVVKESSSVDGRLKASPLAKKMAEEKGFAIEQITGTGEGGRIVMRDVLSFTPSRSAGMASQGIVADSYEDVPVSQMRKAIARRLSDSKNSAPHFYLTREMDMDRVMEARKSINQYLGTKVSFNDIIIKAVAAALKKHPKVNASWMGDSIRYHHQIHIGVATAIDDGLIVPVIKNADLKSISNISAEVKDLAGRAREKKLQPEEFSGNTFTVSNLGMYGIEEFTAIVNPPDSCILAIGAIQQKPVVKNGEIVVGNRMKVTLSCDHRSVDGALGSQFLLTLANFLEEPMRILA